MPRTDYARKIRNKLITEYLEKDPFVNDEKLAESFGVSVNTIRLDLELRSLGRELKKEHLKILRKLFL